MLEFPEPPWIADIENPKERRTARVRFRIRLAAVYYSPKASITRLSQSINLAPNTLAFTTMLSEDSAKRLEEKMAMPKLFNQAFFLGEKKNG